MALTQILLRRDLSVTWNTSNPVLAQGEIALEEDNAEFKIGDGTTSYTNLLYYGNRQYQNVVEFYSSTGTWTVPLSLRYTGARWRVTIVGAGGGGGGTPATASHIGNGGGSGGLVIGTYTYAAGVNTMSYTVGTGGTGAANAAGTAGGATSSTYNSITFAAGGGGGGAASGTVNGGGTGGTATGGSVNIPGWVGDSGGVAATNLGIFGAGASAPRLLGWGEQLRGAAATGTGIDAQGYGAGGSGGKNGATATSRAGGAGARGAIIIEY